MGRDVTQSCSGAGHLLGEILAGGGKAEALGHPQCPGTKVDAQAMAMGRRHLSREETLGSGPVTLKYSSQRQQPGCPWRGLSLSGKHRLGWCGFFGGGGHAAIQGSALPLATLLHASTITFSAALLRPPPVPQEPCLPVRRRLARPFPPLRSQPFLPVSSSCCFHLAGLS